MKRVTLLAMTIFLASMPAVAAEEENGPLSEAPPTTFIRKLEPNRFLTSGGMKVTSGGDMAVEPEFGVSHVVHKREVGVSREDTTHKVHAEAGGRVRLSDRFQLGFATKLPLYNYGATEGITPGGSTAPGAAQRHEYEIFRLSPENLTWTGEMRFRLGQSMDLNLYYDQNILRGPYQPGVKSEEEVFGTRFILRFE